MEVSCQNLLTLFELRKNECKKQQKAYEIWLSFLIPLRWISIVLGVILPAIAGVAIFSDLMGEYEWKIFTAIILLISGITSGLHTALKCDSHQSECLRLVNLYSVLAIKYEDAIILKPDNLSQLQKVYSNEFKTLKENTQTTPAKWCYTLAEKSLRNKRSF